MTGRTAAVMTGIACATALAAGCAVKSTELSVEPDVPAAWSETHGIADTADAAALEQWWTRFADPILDALIGRAVTGNYDLKIAQSRIVEARAERGIAASARLPQVSALAAYARAQRSDATPPFSTFDDQRSPFGGRAQDLFDGGFDAGWELDVFGGIRHDVAAAVAQVQAVEESRRDVLVTLVADVARNYVELRGAQEHLRILDDLLASQRDTREIVRVRFEAGLGSGLDVERATGLVETTASRRPALELVAQRAVHRLGVLVGGTPGLLASDLSPRQLNALRLPAIPSTLPSELLSRRPDLRRAEREVAAATARTGVARADLFPRFAISGAFGWRSQNIGDFGGGDSLFWSFIPGVRWPILSGGRIRQNIRAQDARQLRAVQEYERAVLMAVEDVENALVAFSRERLRVESLAAAVDAQRRAVELATARYTSGLESFLSVLDAQRELYVAEDGLAQTQTASMVAVIAVYKALGGGWTSQEGNGVRPAIDGIGAE
jgi:NodT family efflux transporter outer membrane factor (OMF) lipoprotein